MIRTTLGVSAGAIIIVFAMVFLWPMNGFAASCAGQTVWATWYGAESGHRTADGTPFDGSQWLVAHRTLPFGTQLRLTYLGKSVTAPVRDRGPAKWTGNTVDLSRAVAKKLGIIAAGRVKLCMEMVG